MYLTMQLLASDRCDMVHVLGMTIDLDRSGLEFLDETMLFRYQVH